MAQRNISKKRTRRRREARSRKVATSRRTREAVTLRRSRNTMRKRVMRNMRKRSMILNLIRVAKKERPKKTAALPWM